jgi:hypothetical protein
VQQERTVTLTLEIGSVEQRCSWADWEALGVELARELPSQAVAALAAEVQEGLLEEVCGPRWHPVRGLAAPFACPRQECESREDFARRGARSRPRRLDTAFGTVRLELRNVQCRACGRVFAPLLALLGIPAGVRRSDRLSFTLADLATLVSYRAAARIGREVGGLEVSAGGAHAAIADVAGLLGELPPADDAPEVVLLDGTGGRAGDGKLGVGINLAVGLVGRDGPLRRRRAETVWLGATVGEDWSALERQLAGVAPPALVIVDGEDALTELAGRLWPRTPLQRCWWHLPHGLRKALYRDAAHPTWARHMTDELHGLLGEAFTAEWDRDEALAAWDDLTRRFESAAMDAAVAYLDAARPHAFTFLDQTLQRRLARLGGVDLGSGVIERKMRELNARIDIGGSRWSVAGLRDMITVKTAKMLNHPIWEQLHHDIMQPNRIRFALTSNVNG